MDISYAQRLEDLHLALAFAGEPPGIYVDVGGGHPVADNVTFHLYLDGWSGLVVEPQENLAAIHRAMRPRDTVVTDLVGRASGEADFAIVERFHGFSTMDAANAARAEAMGAGVKRERRPVSTLADLLAKHGFSRIDLLKIDVEGAEADVLAGNDWARFRPRVLVVEAVEPGTMAPAWEGFEPDLVARGYVMALFDGLNRFYVAAEETAIRARMPSTPGDWGAVAHLYDFGRAPERPTHPDHALAVALVHGLLASAPLLDPALIRWALARGLAERKAEGRALAVGDVSDDALRAALGRIASAYDGGHLMED